MADSAYVIRTLGCKANLNDSQRLESELRARGWRSAEELGRVADLCIVNSCTVTDEADVQSRKLASRLARENPYARVVFTGCSAEVDSEKARAVRGVSFVVGNQDKGKLVDLVLEAMVSDPRAPRVDHPAAVLGGVTPYEAILSQHPREREWPSMDSAAGTDTSQGRLLRELGGQGQTATARAFLKIQDGCNAFCTYCIIPYGRGPSRSLPAENVLAQVRALPDEVHEVVITGTNIGDYGSDLPEELPAGGTCALTRLIERMLTEAPRVRVRLSSLDPLEISPSLLALMRSEPTRLCPHFHVSLQSADDAVLRLMKRKYRMSHAYERLHAIESLSRVGIGGAGGVFVGMDIITGFPGETPDVFERSFETLRKLPWSRLHVFPYSERRGTPAERIPGRVSPEERVRRARRLAELSFARVEAKSRAVLESEVELTGVIFDRESARKPFRTGYTANYLRVAVPTVPGQALSGVQRVRPLDLARQAAAGEVLLVSALR